AVALVVLVEQREGAFGGRGRAGEFRGQTLIGAAYFVVPLLGHRAALVNRGSDDLEVVRHLPQYLAVGGLLHIVVGKAGNLFVTIEDDPETITARAFLQERLNPASAPKRNDI